MEFTDKLGAYAILIIYTVPPKSKTSQELYFIIKQETYLKVFLEAGDVPIDNSASERVILAFYLDNKN